MLMCGMTAFYLITFENLDCKYDIKKIVAGILLQGIINLQVLIILMTTLMSITKFMEPSSSCND